MTLFPTLTPHEMIYYAYKYVYNYYFVTFIWENCRVFPVYAFFVLSYKILFYVDPSKHRRGVLISSQKHAHKAHHEVNKMDDIVQNHLK